MISPGLDVEKGKPIAIGLDTGSAIDAEVAEVADQDVRIGVKYALKGHRVVFNAEHVLVTQSN